MVAITGSSEQTGPDVFQSRRSGISIVATVTDLSLSAIAKRGKQRFLALSRVFASADSHKIGLNERGTAQTDYQPIQANKNRMASP
jgi:hypothetical protein